MEMEESNSEAMKMETVEEEDSAEEVQKAEEEAVERESGQGAEAETGQKPLDSWKSLSKSEICQRQCHIWHTKHRAARLLRERWSQKGVSYFAYRKYIAANKSHIASVKDEPELVKPEVDSDALLAAVTEAMLGCRPSAPHNMARKLYDTGAPELDDPYAFEQTSHSFDSSSPGSGSMVRFSRLHPEILACGGSDGSLMMVRCKYNSPPTLLRTLHSHSRRITDIDWSPTDEFLVTTSLDGSTRVWQTAAFLTQTTLEPRPAPEPSSTCGTSGTAALSSPEECFRVFFSKDAMNCVRFHPSNADLLLAGSQAEELRVLHVSTGRQLARRKLGAAAYALEAILSHSLVLVGDGLGHIHGFACDRYTGNLTPCLRLTAPPSRSSPVTTLAFRAWSAPTSCAAVLVSSRDGSATLYALNFINAKKVKLVRAAHLQLPPLVVDVRMCLCPVFKKMILQKHEYVACGREDGGVYIYNLCTPGQPPLVALHERHEAPINAVEWNASGSMLVSSDTNGLVVVWHRARQEG